MRRTVLVVLTCSGLLSSPTLARDVWGQGNVACRETRQSDYTTSNAVGQYVLGHVSGAIAAADADERASTWSAATILDMAYRYCAAHSDEHVHDAAAHVVDQILD